MPFSVSVGIFFHKVGPRIEIRYLDLFNVKSGESVHLTLSPHIFSVQVKPGACYMGCEFRIK